MAPAIHINLDDLGQVEAVFAANHWVKQRKLTQSEAADVLIDLLRQMRSPEDIRADNQHAQWDYQQERDHGWSV